MKTIYIAAVLVTTLGLAACEKQPVVVNVPTPVAVPGPAGPQGTTGTTGTTGTAGADGGQGATGATGATGKTGDGSTTVIVVPPASTPAN